jgi:hypothetical protein
VATMVVLLDHASGEFCLRPQAAQKLAGLGVTSVAVAGNQPTTSFRLTQALTRVHRSMLADARARRPGPRMRTR